MFVAVDECIERTPSVFDVEVRQDRHLRARRGWAGSAMKPSRCWSNLETDELRVVAELLDLKAQVRRVLMKRVGTGILPKRKPVVLTLDELSYRHQDFMCAVGELAPTKRILTLLDNDLVRTIEGYLRALKDSE